MKTKSYECEIKTRNGVLSFWAKAGGYLWVDATGHGGAQACERGHSNAGRAISIGGEYTTLTDDDFRRICRRWMRARARRIADNRSA